VVLYALIALGLRPGYAQQEIDEPRLKGGFLLRFAQFVEWPPEVTRPQPTINLCLAGGGPQRSFLEELVVGETIEGKPLRVMEATPATIEQCHVAFLGGGDAARRRLLGRIAKQPILTVSDAPRFLDEGGIVEMRVVDNRVRFDVDADAARLANLRLHTQLLRLASNVRGGGVR
jgi:hypothetical protein